MREWLLLGDAMYVSMLILLYSLLVIELVCV